MYLLLTVSLLWAFSPGLTKGLTTGSQDFSAATQAFTDGEGGISPSARG